MTNVAQTSRPRSQIEMRDPNSLLPYANNARTHSRKQIRQIADSIERFGFVNPVLIDAEGDIIAGHGRLAAAQLLGIPEVPVLPITHLSPDEKRAYILADNRLAEKAGWDREILAIELQALIDFDFEVEITGFELAEIDLILDEDRIRKSATEPEAADEVPIGRARPGTQLSLAPDTAPGQQFALQRPGQCESDILLFRRTVARPRIDSSMTGIDHHKGAAGIKGAPYCRQPHLPGGWRQGQPD